MWRGLWVFCTFEDACWAALMLGNPKGVPVIRGGRDAAKDVAGVDVPVGREQGRNELVKGN